MWLRKIRCSSGSSAAAKQLYSHLTRAGLKPRQRGRFELVRSSESTDFNDGSISFAGGARATEDLLICFSVGNLCFLRRWYDLEHLQDRALDYYRTGPPNAALLIATLVGSFLLTGLFWGAWRWVERRPTPAKLKLAQCVFLLLMMRSLESVRRYWNTESANITTWAATSR